MGITRSSYLLLAKLKARYELQKERSDVGFVIRYKYAKRKQKLGKLKTLYDYEPERHHELYSPHSIARDSGCGCVFCKAQHKYASAKLHLHYFKQSFYSDFDYSAYQYNSFPIQDNFYALYSEYQSNLGLKESPITQKYRAIQDAIQYILAE